MTTKIWDGSTLAGQMRMKERGGKTRMPGMTAGRFMNENNPAHFML